MSELKKKSIVFIADSNLILLNLYHKLKKKFKIVWIIYHKSLYDNLKNKKIENLHFTNLSIRFLENKNIVSKLLRYLIFGILKIKIKNFGLEKTAKKIEETYDPAFWIADTSTLLSEIKTKAPKSTTHHSVSYKRGFNDLILKNKTFHYLGNKKRYQVFLKVLDVTWQ